VTSASGPDRPGAFDASERDVLERIAGGAPLADVLERIVRLVEDQAPGMTCSILLLDREQQCVRTGAAPSLPPEFNRALDGAPIGPQVGSCGTAAFLGERVIVEDIAVHPYWVDYRHLALPHGLRACWSSPIFSTTREVLGTFAMYYREPRGPHPHELAWVDAATHLAAIAIGHEASAQALRRSEARYRRIAHDLGERVKELTLLHRTASLLQSGRPLGEAFLADLVAPIPRAWQHAEVCVARIACGDVEARTPGWRPTPWMQSVALGAGGLRGVIEVAYLVEKPPAAEGPFLAEERSLLQSLADMLSAHVDREHTQAQLRQAQRIQSLGTLAGGIAHDFNNVLASVGGNVEIAARALPAEHPVRKHLQRIGQATARAADLVKRILAFSRRQEPHWTCVALQPVVDEVLKLLHATLPATIEIRTVFDADAPAVRADASQIHQVLMNLATNAAHAMSERGGVLEVRLEAVTLDADAAAVAPELRAGRYVRLSVGDTGSGMDEATRERIFEPFYTTKAPGHGTGLGLSVVHGIVKSHDGAITVESQVGVGTTLHVYLPAADATMADAAAPAAADLRGHGEHVLYVDDEEAIVEVASRLLTDLGYRVTGATDAGRALADLQSRPYEFDVLVTDLAMPGLPGAELARQVRDIRPGIPVVLTSGYVRPEDADAVQRLGPVDVILKSTLVADLGPTLHRALTGHLG
jgi:signal transduction histidine kinase/ActR/RegA family two-component response regulator